MSYGYKKPRPIRSSVSRLPLVILVIAVALLFVANQVLSLAFSWVDFTAIAIVALLGLRGYLKGFVNSLFGLLGYVIGGFAAIMFSPNLAVYIMENTKIGSGFSDKLNDLVPGLSNININGFSTVSSSANFIRSNPQASEALEKQPILNQLFLAGDPAGKSLESLSGNVDNLNDLLVYSLLRILAIFVLFLVVKLIVVLIGKFITSLMGKSAILGTANRSAGMALGLGIGLILVYALVVYVIPFLGSTKIIRVPEAYEESVLLAWFTNLLVQLRIPR